MEPARDDGLSISHALVKLSASDSCPKTLGCGAVDVSARYGFTMHGECLVVDVVDSGFCNHNDIVFRFKVKVNRYCKLFQSLLTFGVLLSFPHCLPRHPSRLQHLVQLRNVARVYFALVGDGGG